MSLFGGTQIVKECFPVVLFNAQSLFMHIPQQKLCVGRSLLSGLRGPLERLLVVLWNSASGHISPAKFVLRICVSVLGLLLENRNVELKPLAGIVGTRVMLDSRRHGGKLKRK